MSAPFLHLSVQGLRPQSYSGVLKPSLFSIQTERRRWAVAASIRFPGQSEQAPGAQGAAAPDQATRPAVPPHPRACSPRRMGEAGGGTDALIPLPYHERQGRAKSPIVLLWDLRVAGKPVPASGHLGVPAGRNLQPPGKRSAAGLTAASSPHSAPAPGCTFPPNFPSSGKAPEALGLAKRGAQRRSWGALRWDQPGRGRAARGALSGRADLAHSPGSLTCSGLGGRGGKRSGAAAGCARARGFVPLEEGVSRPRPPVGSAHCTTAG